MGWLESSGACWHGMFPHKAVEAHGDIRHQCHCWFFVVFLTVTYEVFKLCNGRISMCLLILMKFQRACDHHGQYLKANDLK